MENVTSRFDSKKAGQPLLTFLAGSAMEVDPSAEDSYKRFSGVAYGGGLIEKQFYYPAPVGFDLAGMSFSDQMPALYLHDYERVVGVINSFSTANGVFSVSGDLFSDIDEDARQIALKSKRGLKWQMSVGIYPIQIEEIRAGSTFSLNGKQLQGPAYVVRQSAIQEVSFTPLGADSSTSSTVYSRPDLLTNPQPGSQEMPDTKPDQTPEPSALEKLTIALTAERDALKQQLQQLTDEISSQRKAAREVQVKELLGEKFSAESAAPYLEMSDDQFAAVKQLFTAKVNIPSHFFSQSPIGDLGTPQTVTPEKIKAFMASNPGSTYEQAFAAIKTGSSTASIPKHF